jgi:hypothetical protein
MHKQCRTEWLSITAMYTDDVRGVSRGFTVTRPPPPSIEVCVDLLMPQPSVLMF